MPQNKLLNLYTHAIGVCFISSDQLGYPRSYAVIAPRFVKPEHNGDNQHMKITSLL